MRFGVSAAIALVVLTGVACDNTTTGAAKSNSVTVGDDYFAPATDTVSVGDTVLFIWAGSATHDVLPLNGGAAWCGSRAGGFCSIQFLTVGSFPYYCHYHAGMQGTIEVR